jgi:hypothetical protein
MCFELEQGRTEADLTWSREHGLPDVFLVEAIYRAAMVRAERDFVARLASDIRDERLGGTAEWRRIHELRASGMSMEEILADATTLLGEEARILEPGHGPLRPTP